MNELRDIIDTQHGFQLRLGYVFTNMSKTERIRYITEMILATQVELVEALNETTWKSWTKGEAAIATDLFNKEMIDVLHFIVNIFMAANPDLEPDALAEFICEEFHNKNRVNHQRQDAGYDAKTTKCPHCGRAVEDIITHDVRLARDTVSLCVCGGVIRVSKNVIADKT